MSVLQNTFREVELKTKWRQIFLSNYKVAPNFSHESVKRLFHSFKNRKIQMFKTKILEQILQILSRFRQNFQNTRAKFFEKMEFFETKPAPNKGLNSVQKVVVDRIMGGPLTPYFLQLDVQNFTEMRNLKKKCKKIEKCQKSRNFDFLGPAAPKNRDFGISGLFIDF